jgi:NADP-reducing hydrogenase subunit HndD
MIDGMLVTVPEDYTVLQAAKEVNVAIPTLCFLKDVNQVGACRMCLVKVEGRRGLQAACVLPVEDGMSVATNTPLIREARKTILELILSNHNRDCTTCVRSQNCELQSLAREFKVEGVRFKGDLPKPKLDDHSPAIVRDQSKCILCRRCISMCHDVQSVGVIQTTYRGFSTTIEPAFGLSLNDVACTYCGQCIQACPVGALREKDDTAKVWQALDDPEKYVIFQVAPSVRFGLGEEFGIPPGGTVTRQMTEAIKKLGADKVFDTNFGADLTIMEEGTELVSRIKKGGILPMITSCSPGWVKFAESYFPDFLPNLSSCKSPMQMMGAVIKTYYAANAGLDPAQIVSVAVMPCTAKKFEAGRPEMNASGYQDVDLVITTRELAQMIKQARLEFGKLKGADFDELIGDGSGAGAIFGATGGVAEAALRTVADILTGEDIAEIEYTTVRGVEGIKEADIPIGDITLKLAVVSGTGNAAKLLRKITAGETHYDFIEIMACPGGCVAGGGQPIRTSSEKYERDFRQVRAAALYRNDRQLVVRKSHQNPLIQQLYADFLESPGSAKAHHLLHTHYVRRPLYPEQMP